MFCMERALAPRTADALDAMRVAFAPGGQRLAFDVAPKEGRVPLREIPDRKRGERGARSFCSYGRIRATV
jgi:hypothetical protein